MDVPVRLPLVPPIWREGLIGLEYASLLRSPVLRGEGVPHGDGSAVLLIPGFLAGDGSLAVMTKWLRGLGYRTKRAGIRSNVACSETVCTALEQRLEELAGRTGDRVAIVGQSRGGVIAKALATRRPDLVSGIVTLGAPARAMLAVHPLVLAQVGLVGTLGTLRLPGFFSLSCLRGECCDRFRSALTEPFPDDVRYISVFSRRDGVVDWRACKDPAADRLVEIRSSHCGMAVHPEALGTVADALAGFRAPERFGWLEAA